MTKYMGILIIFIALALVVSWEAKLGDARMSAAQCKKERRVMINACKPVLYGKLPSTECCKRLRAMHFKCICPVITPKLAALVNVNRAIRLIEGCGRRVPRHFKCGSITTP